MLKSMPYAKLRKTGFKFSVKRELKPVFYIEASFPSISTTQFIVVINITTYPLDIRRYMFNEFIQTYFSSQ